MNHLGWLHMKHNTKAPCIIIHKHTYKHTQNLLGWGPESTCHGLDLKMSPKSLTFRSGAWLEGADQWGLIFVPSSSLLVASSLPWNERLSSTRPLHRAASILEPANSGLNPLETVNQNKPLILSVVDVRYFILGQGK